MIQILNNESETRLLPPVTKVRLPWQEHERDSNESWNEICAWTIDQFGLPGTRFTWHPTEDYMDFWFYNEKDAIHFMLRWS